MAQLSLPRDDRGNTVQALAIAKVQKVTVAATSAALSTAFEAGTRVIRLKATVDCHIAFGGAPTATLNDTLMSAGETEYFAVKAGDKVAVIRDGASDGALYVTEMA